MGLTETDARCKLYKYENFRNENPEGGHYGWRKAPAGKARGKHIFGTAKVGEKGQIVIPKEARMLFGVQPGDTLLILGDEQTGIIVTKPEVIEDAAMKIFEEMERKPQ